MLVGNAALIRALSLLLALFWIFALSFFLPLEVAVEGEEALGFSWHDFLIATGDPMYPLNVQVFMWIAFFYCLGEIAIRWLRYSEEQLQLASFNLYQNPSSVVLGSAGSETTVPLGPDIALKPELLGAIYLAKKKVVPESSLIGSFFRSINFQFHSTNDVGDVYSAVTSLIDLELHKVDIQYTTIRYLAWLVPTLGFIGTVIGIAVALGKAGAMGSADPALLQKVIPLLATAFYTTLLALLLSAVLMIMIQQMQARDEQTVNAVGSQCLEQIVTNLKPRSSG